MIDAVNSEINLQYPPENSFEEESIDGIITKDSNPGVNTRIESNPFLINNADSLKERIQTDTINPLDKKMDDLAVQIKSLFEERKSAETEGITALYVP